jgi:hypothetical protein
MDKLTVSKFDMKSLLPDATLLVLGRRRSGKSWLVRDILYHHRHIPSGVVFSGTEAVSPFFGSFIPDVFIHSEYDPEMINSMMCRQAKKIRECKEKGESPDGKLPKNNRFIVLDDLQDAASTWNKDKTIKTLFFNGRHYNYLFILTLQYLMGITPQLRSNLDYIFIFHEPSMKNRRKIYEDYAGVIPSFEYFCNIMDACTGDNKCLVIRTSGTTFENSVFYYKAQDRSGFKLGHPSIWKFHKKAYNEGYENNVSKEEQYKKEYQKQFGNAKKLKVIVSREGDIVGHELS